MELTGHWAFLQSSAIVRLYGMTLSSPVSMVLEYMRLGPLDQYLRTNKAILKTEDLIEAASNLASALWHLVRYFAISKCTYPKTFSELLFYVIPKLNT